MRTRLVMALAAVLTLAPLAAEAAPGSGTRFTLFSWSWLRAPFAWLAQAETKPVVCEPPFCRALVNSQGFQTFAFDEADHGTGLYVELNGSVQFRSAEIVFAGGDVDRLDLQYATRTDGIFELRDFGRERDVLAVRLTARSVSSRASLAVRFGRALE